MTQYRISDLGFHAFELILAPFCKQRIHNNVDVVSALIGTYAASDGEALSPVSTAAFVTGRVRAGDRDIPYEIQVGKRMAKERKELILKYADKAPVIVDLSESGWEAHYRLLKELATAPSPDMHLSVSDVVNVVSLCDKARSLAVDMGEYQQGTTPESFGTQQVCRQQQSGFEESGCNGTMA